MNVMTGADFAKWRKRMKLSLAEAARELGISKTSVIKYENAPEVPRSIGIACHGIAHDMDVWKPGSAD